MKSNSMSLVGLSGGIVLAALGVFAATGRVAAQGKAVTDVYLDKCAVCHAADGSGKTAKGRKLKVEDVRKTIVKFTVDQMIEEVTKGKAPDMDAFGKEFSADQIKGLVDHYRGLAKK
jgi:cytochrome c oxidase cbb3-type subunit III